jgi:hypothetical protein
VKQFAVTLVCFCVYECWVSVHFHADVVDLSGLNQISVFGITHSVLFVSMVLGKAFLYKFIVNRSSCRSSRARSTWSWRWIWGRCSIFAWWFSWGFHWLRFLILVVSVLALLGKQPEGRSCHMWVHECVFGGGFHAEFCVLYWVPLANLRGGFLHDTGGRDWVVMWPLLFSILLWYCWAFQ